MCQLSTIRCAQAAVSSKLVKTRCCVGYPGAEGADRTEGAFHVLHFSRISNPPEWYHRTVRVPDE